MNNQLTREQILAMPVGREMDVLVARHLYACRAWLTNDHPSGAVWSPHPEENRVAYAFVVPFFSTEIAAAWEIVEELTERLAASYDVPVRIFWDSEWNCQFAITYGVYDDPGETAHFSATGRTAPESICRAALLACLDL